MYHYVLIKQHVALATLDEGHHWACDVATTRYPLLSYHLLSGQQAKIRGVISGAQVNTQQSGIFNLFCVYTAPAFVLFPLLQVVTFRMHS